MNKKIYSQFKTTLYLKTLGFCIIWLVSHTNACFAQLLLKDAAITLDENIDSYSFADINNDGYIDIYIAPSIFRDPDKTGKMWINDGNGNFLINQEIGKAGIGQSVAFHDLNNDGYQDIFIRYDASYYPAPNTGNPNEVWLNDKEGNFIKTEQFLGDKPSNWVELGDIDGNGTIDALVSNYHDAITSSEKNPDEIWFNDGEGKFTIGSQALAYSINHAYLCDIDSDNDQDIVLKDSIWVNNGNGVFTKQDTTYWENSDVTTFSTGDFNNDNYADIYIGKTNKPDEIWLNNGSGQFYNSGQILGGSYNTHSIDVLDIDNDNDMDIYIGYWNAPGKLFINQGNAQGGQLATFLASDSIYPVGAAHMLDINNDGFPDAFIKSKKEQTSTGWNLLANIYMSKFITSATHKETNHPQLTIHPNPTTGKILIDNGNPTPDNISVSICNLLGETIYQNNKMVCTPFNVDITGNLPGLYIMNLHINQNRYSQKIILK